MRQSILLIFTLLGCLTTVFAPRPAQAATNNLGATVYDQNNQGTSAGASFSGNVIQMPNFTTIDFTWKFKEIKFDLFPRFSNRI